jgi:EAL domain-containing protein (putative c-di-GMP-specific phosphodiesterase class I)
MARASDAAETGMFDGLAGSRVGLQGLGGGSIRHQLAAVRRHLGMEVAYVSEFVAGRSVFREVDAPGLAALIKPGDSRSLEDVYCLHILSGRLPELMADISDHPLARSMPITAEVPIGAHLGVPIRLPDGQPYGMFCCLSPNPNPSLNARDLQVMRVFADMAAHEISRAHAAEQARSAVATRIEQLIAGRQFGFRYQPILSMQPFQVVGFEALCRFTPEPYRTPDLWFNEAHAAGCGERLEVAVLREAVAGLALLPEPVFISVNASPSTILGGLLPSVFAGLAMHRLVLEVTEHAPVPDYAALREALAPLRQGGVKLAIDDAGAGYASLQHILQLRPDIIKLDMGLTRGVDRDAAKRALAAALCHFARETDCQIVAEGIETEAEFATLEALGVNKGQGYLLGRPGDLATAREMVGVG